jgi:transposase
MHYVIPENRQQITFIQSLDDLVPLDHFVRLIDALVDAIVSASMDQFAYKGQKNSGRRAYNPITMLKLLLYGYLNSIKTSRTLERECHRNIEVIWLLGNLKPDHKSIADYRKDNAASIKYVTRKFRHFLKDNGYIQGKLIAIDGSKVKANTKKDMLTIKKIENRLDHLDKKLDQYLEQLMINDRREDLLEEFENSSSDDDLNNPGGPNQALLDKISDLQEQVENLQKQKDVLQSQSRTCISPTDPQANLMRSRDGMIPAYNAQIAVDQTHHMIAHSQVFDSPNDIQLLEPMLDELEHEMHLTPEATVTDSGYYNLIQIETVEDNHQTTCYIPIPKHKNDDRPITFNYDKEQDEYRCSQGKRLVLKQKNKIKNGQHSAVYQGIECDGCPMRVQCTTSKYGRIINRYYNHSWRDAYRRRMAGITAKKIIHLRKQMVEHPFGTIKYWMGKIPLLLRGKNKVTTEINIYCTVYNFRRLLSIESYQDIMDMIQKYDWKMA